MQRPIVVVILLAALVLASCSSESEAGSDDGPSPTSVPGVSIPTADGPPAPDPVDPPADGLEAFVTRVIDADSFEVEVDGRADEVRLLGVNAVEGDECLGPEAAAFVRSLIEYQLVILTPRDGGRDDFGRRLAYAWFDGRVVNELVISAGYGVARDQSGHPEAEWYESLEAAAHEAETGLWSPTACGPATDARLRIFDAEPNAPGPDGDNPNGEWIAIVNDGTGEVDLTGWGVRDESTRHRYSFPDGTTLGPGEVVVLYSGCGTDSADELYWCDGDPVWNNSGDTAFLTDPNGNTIDTRDL